LSSGIQQLCFRLAGDNLTMTVRVKLFNAMLHKDISWFDTKNRAPGILTNVLTQEISQLNGLTAESFGIAVEAMLGLVFSIAICLVFSW